ncbi:MAG TPA: hypothetical protein PKV66_04735, partial [Candidatus Pelethenecus sp.]|nr:hypothetical protein [Candidatus Pelethenecus sp.]
SAYQRMLATYTSELKENENKIEQFSLVPPEPIRDKNLQQQVKKFISMLENFLTKDLTFTDIQSFVDQIFVSGSKRNLEILFVYNNVNLLIEEFKCNVLNYK